MIIRYTTLFLIVFFSLYSFARGTNSIKNLDSLLVEVEQKIRANKINEAQEILDNLSKKSIRKSSLDSAKLLYQQAQIYIKDQNDEEGLELLLDGYSKIEDIEIASYHSDYTEAIGQIFGRAQDFDKALYYFKLGIGHAIHRGDSLSLSNANLNVGSIFQMKNELDSAGYYYDKVLQFHPERLDKSETIATVYSNLIAIAIQKGDFGLAETYGNNSLDIHEKNLDTLKMAGVLSNMGSINMYTKSYNVSNDYYFKAYELLKGRTDIKSREILAMTLDNISQIYYLQGDYRTGYDYLFESGTVERELAVLKKENKISEIAAKFELAEEEKRTATEKNKRKITEIWLYALVVILWLLIIFLWLYSRNNRLKREKVNLEFEREKTQQAREIEKMQSEVQIKILNATLDAKENERIQISEILHSNVSSLLSSANMHLYAARTNLSEVNEGDVKKVESIISEASEKVRDLSHRLISSVLLKFGLKSSVEDLCEKYSNSRLVFKFESGEFDRYDERFEMKVHNIIDELTNNIMKHSNAYNARIKLEEVGGRLKIKILDDGDGFDVKKASKKNGLGLSQIAARVKVMKGGFDIKSYENTGTQIFIDIPIPK